MKLSIATVSLGGKFRDKIKAVAANGYNGVEIFESDILTVNETPKEIGQIIGDHGLEILAYQPFRDFETMPEKLRKANFERARRKFALMNELGTDKILICSNVSPHALGGIDRAADDLAELGDVAAGFGITIGYEALAWGRFINDYRDAWEIVRRANHPNVGTVLDSWHIIARGLPLEAIRAIPADKIVFVQLADAPKMSMDLLQWSRHFRNFPGQGDLPIREFMANVAVTGYDGWLSHEIFSDRFRMSDPQRIAEDGLRSFRWLLDGRPDTPKRLEVENLDWLEFALSAAEAAEIETILAGMGFRKTGVHKSKNVHRWAAGDVNLVINLEPGSYAAEYNSSHGPSVVALGLKTPDSAEAMRRAEYLKIKHFKQAGPAGDLPIPAIKAMGDSLLYFVDDLGELNDYWGIHVIIFCIFTVFCIKETN